MDEKRLIAVSATLKPIILASQIKNEDDLVIGTGEKSIFNFLAKQIDRYKTKQIIIILNDDSIAKKLFKEQKLKTSPIKFTNIFLKKTSKQRDLVRDSKIENLYLEENLKEITALFSKQVRTFDLEKIAANEEIDALVQYYLTRFYMDMDSSRELETVIDFLKNHNIENFSSSKAKAIPWPAIQLFLENDSPFLAGSSKYMRALKKRILQVGKTDLRTLIIGETGTGKELSAFFLHDFSERRGKPFIAINCAGLDETFLRAELFGYVKGAYTGATSQKEGLFQKAEGGTLFLDEIGDMPLSVQADLLRFLQNQKYRMLGCNTERHANVRLISAGQQDLMDKIEAKRFRADLFYRLSEVQIKTPSLREIAEDIPRIVRALIFQRIKKGDSYAGKAFKYFSAKEKELLNYQWPGNFRELTSLIKRYTQLEDDIAKELINRTTTDIKAQPAKYYEVTKTEEIRTLNAVISEYVKKIRWQNTSMSLKDLAKKLKISVNTLKKYSKDFENIKF